jgi:MFS family permease
MRIPPALKHRSYFLLWSGQLISITGSQMQLWALYWHVRQLTADPIAVSGVGLVKFLPVMVLSLLAGVIADRINRRTLIILTQSCLALVALLLGVFTKSGSISLTHIYILLVFQSIAVAFDVPARQALIPNLVPARHLSSAYSMNSIASNTGAIIGPAVSGLIIGYFGLQFTYFINSLSYLAVIIAFLQVGDVPGMKGELNTTKHTIGSTWEEIKEGIQFIQSKMIIKSTMLLDFFATFFSSANTLLPFVALDILDVGPIEYGWLSASQAIGTVGAALIISQKISIRRQGLIMISAVTTFGFATVLFGLSRNFWLTMASLILIGAMDGTSTILRNTTRQLQTPNRLRGRMVSINQIFFKGGPQLGEMESGIVAQLLGVQVAIVTGGIGCVLAVGGICIKWKDLITFDSVEKSVGERSQSVEADKSSHSAI